jgi:hypothetical protein
MPHGFGMPAIELDCTRVMVNGAYLGHGAGSTHGVMSDGRLWLALILSDLKCCGLQFISFILLALSVCVRNVSSTASSPHARHTPPELNCVDPNQIGLERYSLLLHSLTPRSMRGGLLSQFINADIFMPSFPPNITTLER